MPCQAIPACLGYLLCDNVFTQVRGFAHATGRGIVSQSVQWAPINKVVAAGIALSSSNGLNAVLQTLVDTARDISGARYAALGVLDATGSSLAQFLTSGVPDGVSESIGTCPIGRGLLGVLIKDPRPLRLGDVQHHPMASGLPDGHPPINSLLGVPIIARARVFGNLYVAEKIDDLEFTEDDLSLLKMLAALAAAAIENAQLREERDRFFAAASHELGNAVAGVRLWAEHLQDMTKEAPSNWLTGLDRIKKGADGAHKLIDDLLSLARIREGRLTLVPWPVDVSVVMLESAEQYRPEIERAGLQLDTSAVERDVVIQADSARVRQIFVNLISNALKFTSPGTTISLGVQRSGNEVVSFVADQGPGIAAVDAERIFHPYEQVSGVARGRGAGLGLPLSRQLARLMGGNLVLDRREGPGARFVLSLPVTDIHRPK